jgi:hypothetical protein
MRKTAFLASLVLAVLAGAVVAQEPAPPAEHPQQDELTRDEFALEEPAAPLHTITVLGNPYELASYYRAQSGGFYDYRPAPASYPDRYPIASYYRMQSSGYHGEYPVGYGPGYAPGAYAPFWNYGYAQPPGIALHYRQRIGQNGELFLFAPTFLAPIGPLTGAFFFGFGR